MGLFQLSKKSNDAQTLSSLLFVILVFQAAECNKITSTVGVPSDNYQALNCRKHIAILTDFGGKGDGEFSNTNAFQSAIDELSKSASDGGALLIVPPGKWLTGSFNLSSHFTLYLQKGATILASQDESDFPIIEPLPSYGRGLYTPDGRYSSLIRGINLTDVIITGSNGTIDGQGALWWDKFKQDQLTSERPYLIEIMNSNQVQISNITLTNSPMWHIHPVYCRDVIVQGVTILAPVDVPNTDGINPDSCTNVKIEDVYVVSGDDCIAVKSGLDQYGIKYRMPTQHVIIRKLTCVSPKSSVIAIGSEMSGGIQDVRAEQITAINSESGVRIKTARGRGGYVKDIYVRGMKMHTMKYAFWMTGAYKLHAHDHFNPEALPTIHGINYRDIVAENVSMVADLEGLQGDPFTGICISNATIKLAENPKKILWNCTDIQGETRGVQPKPCSLLLSKGSGNSIGCAFPTNKLPIENVELKICKTSGISTHTWVRLLSDSKMK